MIKAIETVYRSYKFRSRLEARWAVFFDTLGIKYEYEKEGYDLDGTWYLPDFWLPELDCWVEIKGQEPTCDEYARAFFLSVKTGKRVFIFFGNIEIPIPIGQTSSSDEDVFASVPLALLADGIRIEFELEDGTQRVGEIPLSNLEEVLNDLGVSKKVRCLEKVAKDIISRISGAKQIELYLWQGPMFWTQCIVCKKLDITYRGFFTRMPCKCVEMDGWKEGDDDYYAFNVPRLIAAYTAARQARFEHGQTPRIGG